MDESAKREGDQLVFVWCGAREKPIEDDDLPGQKVLDSGLRTADLSGGRRSLGTSEMADAVVAAIDGAPAKEHHAP